MLSFRADRHPQQLHRRSRMWSSTRPFPCRLAVLGPSDVAHQGHQIVAALGSSGTEGDGGAVEMGTGGRLRSKFAANLWSRPLLYFTGNKLHCLVSKEPEVHLQQYKSPPGTPVEGWVALGTGEDAKRPYVTCSNISRIRRLRSKLHLSGQRCPWQ